MQYPLTEVPTPMDEPDAPPPRPRPRSWPASSTDRDQTAARVSPDDVCAGCNGAGYYTLAVPVSHSDFGRLFACDCLLHTREQRAQLDQARQTSAVLARLARELGRLTAASFATFDLDRPLVELTWAHQTFPVVVQRQALDQALRDAHSYAEAPTGWLFLCGPCGAGKSHLAAAIANHLATNSWGVTYASVPDLLRFVRGGIRGGEADVRMDALMHIDLLVLDDIGAEYLTVWAQEQLFILLNARYLADRATILTSNDRLEALPARLASRIRELGQIIWLPVSDYRRLRAL
jgi:DNA replication protein DnaC